jgi:hypothetical protein
MERKREEFLTRRALRARRQEQKEGIYQTEKAWEKFKIKER